MLQWGRGRLTADDDLPAMDRVITLAWPSMGPRSADRG